MATSHVLNGSMLSISDWLDISNVTGASPRLVRIGQESFPIQSLIRKLAVHRQNAQPP